MRRRPLTAAVVLVLVLVLVLASIGVVGSLELEPPIAPAAAPAPTTGPARVGNDERATRAPALELPPPSSTASVVDRGSASAPAPWSGEALPGGPCAVGLVLEGERLPPPLRWTVPPPATPAEALERTLISVDLRETPVLTALEAIEALGPFEIDVDAEARTLLEPLVVSLVVTRVPARVVLDFVVQTSDEVTVALERSGARVHAAERPPAGLAPLEPPPAPLEVELARLIEAGPRRLRRTDWRWEYRQTLERRKVSVTFDDAPLDDVVSHLQDITGLNIILSPAIDAQALKVTYAAQDRQLLSVLRDVLRAVGVSLQFRNETLVLRPIEEGPDDPLPERGPDPGPSIADQRLALDLRGIEVFELVAALEVRGLRVFASERAWRAKGTFSFACDGPLEDGLWQLHRQTGVFAWISHDPQGDELVLIDGERTSVDDALASDVPPFPGVRAQVDDQRARLSALVLERRRIRGTSDRARLLELEGEVEAQAAALTALLTRVWQLARAPEQARELEAALAVGREAVAAARTAGERLVREQTCRALEDDLGRARALEAALPALVRGEPLEAPAPDGS